MFVNILIQPGCRVDPTAMFQGPGSDMLGAFSKADLRQCVFNASWNMHAVSKYCLRLAPPGKVSGMVLILWLSLQKQVQPNTEFCAAIQKLLFAGLVPDLSPNSCQVDSFGNCSAHVGGHCGWMLIFWHSQKQLDFGLWCHLCHTAEGHWGSLGFVVAMTTTKPKLPQWPSAVWHKWHQSPKPSCF